MRRRRRGQALVEFALVIPVFIVVVFGIFDAGRLVFTQNELSQLASQAARQVAVRLPGPPCDTTTTKQACVDAIVLEQRVATDSTATVRCLSPLGTVKTPTEACAIGDVIEVTATATWSALTPVIGQLIGPKTLTAIISLPVE